MLTYRCCEPAEEAALRELLFRLDGEFPIPLSRKTDLAQYGKKLLEQGTVCGAWDGEQMVGLCGFYANDLQTRRAYAAVLGVLPSHQRRGIAGHLLADALEICRSAGMEQCSLYTHQTNLGAIALYRSFGFSEEITAQRPEDILFTKDL